MDTFLAVIGRVALNFLAETGRLSLFMVRALTAILRPPFFVSQFLGQILRIGYFSLPVVGLTLFFTGAALAYEIYIGGSRFNAESIVPTIVALGITRELAPVIGGLMVAGRVSAAIAAEIGTMRVTEQIDALKTLSTNPYNYLVVPRLLAAIVTLPFLIFVGDIIGVMGGFMVSTGKLDFNAATYVKNTWDFLETQDVTSGLWKAGVFGFIVALLGCYHGFNSKGGAQGVGTATTHAVVAASILILAANYLMTSFLFTE
jgi:phospholipid/cholesterol/gamma-HCH transport system permease protein